LATISLLLTHNIAGLLGIALMHAAALGPIAPISDALAATAAQASGRGAERRFEMAACEPRDRPPSRWGPW